jgi:hypothetical protein
MEPYVSLRAWHAEVSPLAGALALHNPLQLNKPHLAVSEIATALTRFTELWVSKTLPNFC